MNSTLKPAYIELAFPVPDEIVDEKKGIEFLRKGKSFYSAFRKSGDVSNLSEGIKTLNLSVEKLYRVKKKGSDGKTEGTQINEAIDYLILLNSFALEYVKDDIYSGEKLYRLISLVEQKKYTNPMIAEAVARYYLHFFKTICSKRNN